MNATPFDSQRRIGTVTHVFPDSAWVNLEAITQRTGRVLEGEPLRGGQVGDFVLIDCDSHALLARILEVKLPERERLDIEQELGHAPDPHPLAKVHLLGALDTSSNKVVCGIARYPALGACVFAASAEIVTHFAASFSGKEDDGKSPVTLKLGWVPDAADTLVEIRADHLFARHCAILGATGGGKSTTVARLVEQCLQTNLFPKIILIDPTGEYAPLAAKHSSLFLGSSQEPNDETKVRIPCEHLQDADYMSILAPSPSQRPKLIEAIQSLRLVKLLAGKAFPTENNKLASYLTQNGLVEKSGHTRRAFYDVRTSARIAERVEDPKTPFEFGNLSAQIMNECVQEGFNNNDIWSNHDQARGWCQPLVSKINILKFSAAWIPIFGPTEPESVFSRLELFFKDQSRLLRLNLSDLSFYFRLREIAVNLIGRWLREYIRDYKLRKDRPVLVVLDEAHNFLNRQIGEEDCRQPLDAFENIAKEGRKYWLNLVLATQQPREIPPTILSQMGTLIVHRLINEADRKVVEAACGQLDAAAAKFLPGLAPGEAAIIGVDFPIPLTIQMEQPPKELRPKAAGPDFKKWLEQYPPAKPPILATPAAAIASAEPPTTAKEEDDVPF